jgi:hypothetical protein
MYKQSQYSKLVISAPESADILIQHTYGGRRFFKKKNPETPEEAQEEEEGGYVLCVWRRARDAAELLSWFNNPLY